MASFDYRLNPLYTIKECSSCGALYNKGYWCSNVSSDSSQQPLHDCPKCGNPVDGLRCQQCPLLRKKLKKVWFTICEENGIFQDLLNTSESSDDNTNFELAEYINLLSWNRLAYYYEDDDEEYTIAITPVLSTEEPVNSLSMGDEHLDNILETESDEVIKSSVEDLIPIPSESEGIPDKMCDVPFRDNSPPLDISKDQFEGFSDSNDDSTSIDDDSFSIDDIDYVEASPPDSELVSLEESSSTSPNLFLEETNTFDNSIPESKTFCFDLEENSSGSTTTLSDYSLPDYEAFYFDDDHIEEKSSGSTTTHSDISLSKYDSFIFDLSNDPFPPADRSDFYHEEFADELAHIISPPEYDCFYFKSEPDPGELTSIVDSGIRENVLSTTNVNLPFEDDQSPLLAYVVWIFLPFLTYPVTPPYLLSCGNEDTIFDPGISIYHSFMPSVSHRSGTFMKFNVYPNNLNESPMEILSSTCSPMDQ
ncbi:hypothetical protein Tco_0477423 [Tanacetum coccineum]